MAEEVVGSGPQMETVPSLEEEILPREWTLDTRDANELKSLRFLKPKTLLCRWHVYLIAALYVAVVVFTKGYYAQCMAEFGSLSAEEQVIPVPDDVKMSVTTCLSVFV
ncbi:hypothetical protein KIPB_012469 [Kipferlia bialata]|uniref:Uncharacterized protein n=1 Tax=Kipferlia bialata TaxID=797122 RepID=A0A391NR40_9EUKA|nr:hypothetical protein KIPB_012469 [Kipferlia bialata]|eukprot:g12469.t1